MRRIPHTAGVALVAASAVFATACSAAALLPPRTGTGSSAWSVAAVERPGAPVRLRIPSIGVDAAVEHVGVTEEGDMAPPEAWENVGWYRDGPRPGERGNAVIDGHLDSYTGTAVFWDVRELLPGDEVEVEDASGTTRVFRVAASRRFSNDDPSASAEIFGATDERRLNLITCGGSWNGQQYAERLVVFTELVSVREKTPSSGL